MAYAPISRKDRHLIPPVQEKMDLNPFFLGQEYSGRLREFVYEILTRLQHHGEWQSQLFLGV